MWGSPDQAAQYHISVFKLGTSSLTRYVAGYKVMKLRHSSPFPRCSMFLLIPLSPHPSLQHFRCFQTSDGFCIINVRTETVDCWLSASVPSEVALGCGNNVSNLNTRLEHLPFARSGCNIPIYCVQTQSNTLTELNKRLSPQFCEIQLWFYRVFIG